MANDYTRFSCLLDLGDAAHIDRALQIHAEMAAGLEADDDLAIGFVAERSRTQPTALWLHDGGESGEPEHVIAFALRCAEAFDLKGRWGFCWALTCSSARLDGFGGGAQVLDLSRRRSVGWVDCSQWLATRLQV